ncbi:MAG: DUF192 domain-containing protein [Elusimicrobia bacterium]|nr:DUF192 domain-containing protein [Elusimicrobiota bacterium]
MKINNNLLAVFLAAVLCGNCCAEEKSGTPGIVSLTMPDGSVVEAELALTPQTQERGLMFRETLPDNAGMLFVFKEDGPRTFWMKSTYISLDIVFLDGNMKVRNIFHRVPRSNPEQPEIEVARVSAPAKFVLELAAGKAKKCRLKPDYLIKASPSLITKAAAPRAAPKGKAAAGGK